MKRFWILLVIMTTAWSCGEDDGPNTNGDNFDRSVMLANWADNIIVPAYRAYAADLSALELAVSSFLADVSQANLDDLRSSWLQAYISWQWVSMFEIGKAEEVTLRDFTNVFPTAAAKIETNISNGGYNLELPSTRDQQGFPALDYLLHGIAATDVDILTKYQSGQGYEDYLKDIVSRLADLTNRVVSDWENGYRDIFVSNDGSSGSSSVNKLVNDFMFYYERALRAGKIGIPAGVFSSSPLGDKVEGFYAGHISKALFENALQAVKDFFNGKHFKATGEGVSLKAYLDFLQTISSSEHLSKLINDQFLATQTEATNLLDNFTDQVESDNSRMLAVYDALQVNVVLLKVDMFQALTVQVDFVDADGD